MAARGRARTPVYTPPCPGQSGAIFTTRTGRTLDRHHAAHDLNQIAASVGIAAFSPHVLRHTFVTLARQAGCTLEVVQDAAGHSDPATTRAYDRNLLQHRDHPGSLILAALPAHEFTVAHVAELSADHPTMLSQQRLEDAS